MPRPSIGAKRIGLAVVLVALPSLGSASDPLPCVVLSEQALPQDPRQEPPVAQVPQTVPAPEADLRRPPSEADVVELIATLEAANGGATTAPVATHLPADRLRVVLDDVTALLVAVEAREAAQRPTGRTSVESRKWLDAQVARIQTCVAGRYQDRGGEPAYRGSVALLEKHRAKLEPLLLGLGRRIPAAPEERR